MQWHAKGLAEGPAAIVRAQANPLCEFGKRYWLNQVLLDIVDSYASLPGLEPAMNLSLRATSSHIPPRQLMSQDGAESFEVESIV